MWLTPKTDWVITDFLTYNDWNRIIGNLDFLYNTLLAMGYTDLESVTMTSTGLTKTVSSLVFASDLNAIENDLHNINDATFHYDIGTKMTFSSFGKAPNYQEINRIETAISMLYAPIRALDPIRMGDAVTMAGGDFGLL